MYSTQRNTTRDVPELNGAATVGRYLRYPDQTGKRVVEGGLRIQGLCKHSLPNLPLVSIITVCLNSAKTLEQTIQSVLSQTYANIEYIIIDACSSDGTLDLIRKYENGIDYFVSEPDRGLYHAMNKGLALAQGDYILILNSDDWYAPDCVEILVRAKKYAGTDFVSALAQYVDHDGKPVQVMRSMPYDASMRLRMPLRHETMLLSAAIYNDVGFYDESYRIIADFHLTVRVFEKSYSHYEVPRPLLFFRNTGVSNISKEELFSERERLIKIQFPFLEEGEERPFRELSKLMPDVLEKLARKHSRQVGFVDSLKCYFENQSARHDAVRWNSYVLDWGEITGVQKRPLVSVILPIYAAQETLAASIESVLFQSLRNLELICVNDASPDKSQEIVEQYCLKDSRIISLVNESNVGLGASRNRGVREARGAYIFHIDPDDIIPPNALETFYAHAVRYGSDMIKGAYLHEQFLFGQAAKKSGHRGLKPGSAHIVNTTLAKMPDLLKTTEGHWSYLYKSEFAKKVPYPIDLKMGQDSIFIVSALVRARKVSIVDDVVYHYRANPESAMNIFTFRKYKDALEWRRRAWHVLKDAGMQEIGDRLLQAYWGDAFFRNLVSGVSGEQLTEFLDHFRRAFAEAGISAMSCEPSSFLKELFPLILEGKDADALALMQRDTNVGRYLRYPDQTGKRVVEGGLRNSGVSNTNMAKLYSERATLLRRQFPFLEDDEIGSIAEWKLDNARLRHFLGKYGQHTEFVRSLRCFVEDRQKSGAARWEDVNIQWPAESGQLRKHFPRKNGKLSVATLCSMDHGGAGTGTQRRVEALRRNGVDARIFSLVVKSTHPYVERVVPELPSVDTAQQMLVWKAVRERVILPAKEVPGFCASELFSLTDSVVDFGQLAKCFDTHDVIHLHWVVGMLDYKRAGILAEKPVVWTLADMNAFTGGCHYSESCEEYKKECKQCPLLGGKSSLAHETWKIKKAAYQQLKNLHIICPSCWMAERVAQSSLLGDRDIHYIPNAFPIDRFKLTNKMVARIRLGLPVDKKLLLFGAESLRNYRKGSDLLKKTLEILSQREQKFPVEIVVFGNSSIELPMPVHSLGYIADDNKLALAYSAADAFLFPSREDNAPLTVGESLLCGTPVVAFPVGHVPDIVQHGITGYIAKYLDVDDFAQGIHWAFDTGGDASLNRDIECRLAAQQFHEPQMAAERHIAVYEAALSRSATMTRAGLGFQPAPGTTADHQEPSGTEEGMMSTALKAKKVIIHFGMDKTGSTSIRASLARHLADPEFHYVILGISNASRSLAAGFKDDPGSFSYYRNSGLSANELNGLKAKAIEDLAAELQKAAGKTAIMSAEAVSTFKESEFRRLCDVAGAYSMSISAVGYIRRPKEYMESNLQQQIKGHFAKQLVPNKLFSNYRKRFEKFDTVLGRENVQLWLFDPKSFPGQCVVQDFCARLGMKFRDEDVIRVNEGLTLPALSLLFAYRKYGNGYVPGPSLVNENAVLLNRLQRLSGPKLRLHSTLVAPVIKANREGIVWMEERLGVSLAENLTEYDEDAIRSEADLLKFTPESLQWLAEQLGPKYAKRWHPELTPQEVAKWMQLLSAQLQTS